MTAEIWKAVPGFDGEYEVSNIGRVRSLSRARSNGGGRQYTVGGCVLSLRKNQHGYMVVGLRSGAGTRTFHRVHRLVAEVFVPNPENKPHINHLDHDRARNVPSNLEWCTQAENLAHMTRAGRRARPWANKRGPRASLSDAEVRAIRNAAGSGHEIAETFNISKSAANRIRSRKAYSHVR